MTSEVNLPSYYRVLETPEFDSTSIGVKVHKLDCSNNNQSGLNNSQVKTFKYVGDQKCIRLHPFLSGFRVRAGFKTQTHAGTDESTANITLANNWFWHLWSQYKLKVANKSDLESISNIGEFTDIMTHFRGDELKRMEGQLNGFIRDEGSGLAVDIPIVATNPVVTAGAATAANFVTISNNANYNRGYHKRKNLYNYACADADIREIEQFFPLFFSGFFNTDTCLMNTSFEIELTRKAGTDFKNAIFGADTTDIIFGTGETELLSVTLELYEQIPEKIRVEPSLLSVFGNTNKEPKPLAYLKASCQRIAWGESDKYTISETSYHVPRFVFIGIKGADKIATPVVDNSANTEKKATGNYSLWSHANIQSIKVSINGQQFPADEQDAKFLKNQFSIFYQSYVDTCRSLPYGGSVSLDMNEFKDLYPIFAFNCENQEPKISTNTTNLKVELKRRAKPADNTNRKDPQVLEIFMVVLEDQYAVIDAVRNTCNVYSKPV